MRYAIKDNKIVESMFIDAPYDCFKDAQDAMANLLNPDSPQTVIIDGNEYSTEEAALTFEEMSQSYKDNLKKHMSDFQIVVHIYRCPLIGFNYIK